MATALQILVVVTLIGIIAGLAVTRYGRGWFGTRASDLTAALVGIAGAFLGFHVGVAAGLTPVPVAGLSRRNRGSLRHPLGVAESLTP